MHAVQHNTQPRVPKTTLSQAQWLKDFSTFPLSVAAHLLSEQKSETGLRTPFESAQNSSCTTCTSNHTPACCRHWFTALPCCHKLCKHQAQLKNWLASTILVAQSLVQDPAHNRHRSHCDPSTLNNIQNVTRPFLVTEKVSTKAGSTLTPPSAAVRASQRGCGWAPGLPYCHHTASGPVASTDQLKRSNTPARTK
jgi:hypothetical protein